MANRSELRKKIVTFKPKIARQKLKKQCIFKTWEFVLTYKYNIKGDLITPSTYTHCVTKN